MAKNLKVSVVINTCDRGIYLSDTLEGLKQQTYDDFEIIVVNGPSQDNTEEVAKRYNVRYYRAPFNLSVSRNVGVKHAAGDIIAFIDDDAVPESHWIEDIVKAYDDPAVGAAGGFVYNHDGSDFQYCYGAIDKWGYAIFNRDTAYDFNKPNNYIYNINIGTNASYRRQVLIEIGGFDEEIEYYHDESDVCVRLINHGFKVAELNNAFVHHKMAPSTRRDSLKRVTNWDAIVKNSIYFGVKHTKNNTPMYKRLIRPAYKESKKFEVMYKELIHGQSSPRQYIVRNASLIRAMYRGYKRGFSSERKMLSGYKYEPGKFQQFKTAADVPKENPMTIVLVSQGFPPANTDGISRYNATLAKELVGRGHSVFVVTKTTVGHRQIFYKDKYWVYYHNPAEFRDTPTGFTRTDDVLASAKSIYNTVAGISKKYGVDVVLAPLWDVEGVALIRHKIAPTILTLMSPLKKVVETQWYWLDDPSLEIMYELEEYCIKNADGVMAISNAIMKTIGEDYAIDWNEIEAGVPVEVVPLGVDKTFIEANEQTSGASDRNKNNRKVSILFVGRFEKRKGIDLLFDVIPDILEKYQDVEFHLVGNAKIADENGRNPYNDFVKKYRRAKWFKRLIKHGYVTDEELARLYSSCDIFVAPSRYESFGIIFIEAMAFGKPLVGTDIGGIPEILRNEENGLLFKAGDGDDLQNKLERLITDKVLRAKMGQNSRKLLETSFTAEIMGNKFIKMVDKVTKRTT